MITGTEGIDLAKSLAIGAAAGLAGSTALYRTSVLIYDRTPERIRDIEDELEPQQPFVLATKKAVALTRRNVSQKRAEQVSGVATKAISIAAGTTLLGLRRVWPGNWFTQGLAFGTLFWAVNDETVGPLAGLVGDNRAYPAASHLRGLAAHAAFGVVAAAVIRALAGPVAGPE